MQRDGLLGIAHGLELEQRLTQQPPGRLAGGQLDLDGRERDERVEEVDPGRQPLERGHALRPGLLPAPEQEQRIRGVAAQEVAVDRLQPGRASRGDALEGNGHRLLVPARRGPARWSGWRRRGTARRDPRGVSAMRRASVSIATAASGSARQPSDTPRVVVACSSQMAAGGLAGAGDADGVAGELLGDGERALQHPELGQPGHDRGARDRRRRRDELHRAPSSGDRALGIAGHPPELAEPVVDQARGGSGPGGHRPRRWSHRGRPPPGPVDPRRTRLRRRGSRGRSVAGLRRSRPGPRRRGRLEVAGPPPPFPARRSPAPGRPARRPASRRLRPDPPPRWRPGRPPAHRARSGSGASP